MSNDMNHQRCYVSPDNWQGDILTLDPTEEHHLLHVMRLGDGDRVTAFDGLGRQGEAELRVQASLPRRRAAKASREPTTARLLHEYPPTQRTSLLYLVQAVPKGKRMDFVIEKATELGTAVIQPVSTQRVVVQPDKKSMEERAERWQKIALNAARQCGTPWIPDIKPACPIGEALQNLPKLELLLVGSLEEGVPSLRSALRNLAPQQPRRIGLIIGPEGDLTPDELEESRKAGALAVSFGSLVLRVETAAIYGLSVLSYELGT